MTVNRRTGTIAAWLFVVVTSGYLAFKVPVVTDLTLFLQSSGGSGPAHQLIINQGPVTRLILVSIHGADTPRIAEISKLLTKKLGNDPMFARVTNGDDDIDKHQYELLLRYRYLFSPDDEPARFTQQGLRTILTNRLQELASPLASLDRSLLAKDPTGEVKKILSSWRGKNEVHKRYGVWFSHDNTRALLIAETRAAGFDIDAQGQVVERIKTNYESAVKQTGVDRITKLELSGPGVFAVNARTQIRYEAQVLSIAASISVLLILLVAYRSRQILLLAVLPLGTAVLVAMATVGTVFGYVHGITLAFGSTLLGIAIDYPIHVFSHLRPPNTTTKTLHRIWPTLLLSATTSIIGYTAMATTDFSGLMHLGLFAMTGLITAITFTRLVLPVLLPQHWSPLSTPPEYSVRLLRQLPDAQRFRLLLLLIGLSLLVIQLTVMPLKWEENAAALSPIPETDKQRDRLLRTQTGAPHSSNFILLRGDTAERVLQNSEIMAQYLNTLISQGDIKSFDAPHVYLPSVKTQIERRNKLPTSETLTKDLNEALRGLPFRKTTFTPFIEGVNLSHTLTPLRYADLQNTLLGTRLAPLLFKNGDKWNGLLLLTGVEQTDSFRSWFERHKVPNADYFNTRTETNRLMNEYRSEAVKQLAWGCAIIVLLLWISLRHWKHLLKVLIPVTLAVIVTLFTFTVLEERLTFFHLVSLLLVVGTGLDYSLFFSRPGDDLDTRARTLHAVLICAASTIAVFAILATSDLLVLRAIGSTVVIGVLASMLFSILLATTRAANEDCDQVSAQQK